MVSVKEGLPDNAVFEQMSGGIHSRQREQPGRRPYSGNMLGLFWEKPRKLVWLQESK